MPTIVEALRTEAAQLDAEAQESADRARTLRARARELRRLADAEERARLSAPDKSVTNERVKGNHVPHALSSRLAMAAGTGRNANVLALRERNMTLGWLREALEADGLKISSAQLSRVFSGKRTCPTDLAERIMRLTETDDLPGIDLKPAES